MWNFLKDLKKLIIPNSDRSIDIIHSMEAYHIENISDVFKEFRRVLSKTIYSGNGL